MSGIRRLPENESMWASRGVLVTGWMVAYLLLGIFDIAPLGAIYGFEATQNRAGVVDDSGRIPTPGALGPGIGFGVGLGAVINPSNFTPSRRPLIPTQPQGASEDTVDLLVDLLANDKNETLKVTIMEHLASLGASEEILSIARSALSATVRRSAVARVAEMPGSYELLVSLLEDESDILVKRAIIYWIARSGDARARAKLLDLVRSDDEDVQVRRAALYHIVNR